jgi:hypothetical protein
LGKTTQLLDRLIPASREEKAPRKKSKCFFYVLFTASRQKGGYKKLNIVYLWQQIPNGKSAAFFIPSNYQHSTERARYKK